MAWSTRMRLIDIALEPREDSEKVTLTVAGLLEDVAKAYADPLLPQTQSRPRLVGKSHPAAQLVGIGCIWIPYRAPTVCNRSNSGGCPVGGGSS